VCRVRGGGHFYEKANLVSVALGGLGLQGHFLGIFFVLKAELETTERLPL
jgi:hypothetical protein